MDIPLGINAANYNSVRSKGNLVNMLAEINKDGSYVAVKRTDGLTLQFTSGDFPMRSNIHNNGGYMYFLNGSDLYRSLDGTSATSLGAVGGIGRGQILSNAKPGDNQILILNGDGLGYIFDSSGLNQITDADFFPTTSATILNERFWFVRDGSNEIFASDVSDGTAYDPLSFATAEWKPDNMVVVVSINSALWAIGTNTAEYWQSFSNSTVPIRAVRGASKERGILAKNSFAELDEYFAFLGDAGSVVLVKGDEMITISDIDLENKIRGDGTLANPGIPIGDIEDCYAFFVDQPHHKSYYLTFPSINYTWGFDVENGLTHTRESYGIGGWRAANSITRNNKIFIGDRIDGSFWLLDPKANVEGTALLIATMRTPSISFKTNITIPSITVDIEVGQGEDPTATYVMLVKYSRDGGYNWINHSDISLGNTGDHRRKVILRDFGRLVKGKDFVLEFSVSDAVRVQIYGLDADIQDSV
jgi:hypothetical protein